MVAAAHRGDVVRVTDAARECVISSRPAGRTDGELALWIEAITTTPDGDPDHDVYLFPREQAGPDDVVQELEDLPVVIPRASVDALRGSVLDVLGDESGALTIHPPGRSSPAVGLTDDTAFTPSPGDVEQQVAQVISERINPAIAVHGGRAELVDVEGDVAQVRLQGGCQGCGMAAVTLRQGIEAAITSTIPAIRRVVDVTDHPSGAAPFYGAVGG